MYWIWEHRSVLWVNWLIKYVDLTKNNLYLLNGCDLPLKILRLNLEGFSRGFHVTISSQILKGAIHRLKFFARIWEVFQGCFIWEFLPNFFFYFCIIVWWKLCLITRIHSKSIFVKTFEFVAWRRRLSDFKLIFALRKPMQQLLGIKEKTKFSNVDNFYKGKFQSLSDFFISLHTLAQWIFIFSDCWQNETFVQKGLYILWFLFEKRYTRYIS